MSLTPNEAADALRDIERTGRRSGQAFGYRHAGPYFILWGMVWIVGYVATDFVPQQSGFVWLGAVILGAIGSAVIGRNLSRSGLKGGANYWKSTALVVVIWLYIVATYAVMWPIGPKQQSAFVPLIAAAVYSGVGVFAGMRWVIAGLAIGALTLIGFFFIHQHFNLWMAAVGGGGLILAGLWMRSA